MARERNIEFLTNGGISSGVNSGSIRKIIDILVTAKLTVSALFAR
jgi:hypothetical protein